MKHCAWAPCGRPFTGRKAQRYCNRRCSGAANGSKHGDLHGVIERTALRVALLDALRHGPISEHELALKLYGAAGTSERYALRRALNRAGEYLKGEGVHVQSQEERTRTYRLVSGFRLRAVS